MVTFEAYDAVKEFHLKFGHHVYNGLPCPQGTRLLRVRLLLEELGELACAIHEGDRVLVADALTDLLYVTVGAAVSCLDGELSDLWEIPTRIMFEPRSIRSLVQAVGQLVSDLELGHDWDVLSSSLNLVWYYLAALALAHDVPLRACFFEVHRSNMTKTVIDTTGGKKGSVKGPGYEPPQLAKLL